MDMLNALNQCGAIITNDHFVYKSGLHGAVYVNKDALYTNPELVSIIGEDLAEFFHRKAYYEKKIQYPEIVIGPVIGGVALSQWTTWHLLKYDDGMLRSIFAEKEGNGFIIKRGYEKLIPKRNILVVEDILTTGGTVKKVVEAVRALGGNIVGVGAICNRGGITAEDLGVPILHSLVDLPLETYTAYACPLCKDGVPINTTLGHGKEFLECMKTHYKEETKSLFSVENSHA